MKVLLTGATGYIGKRLLPVLLEQGHDVYCVVREPKRFAIPSTFKGKCTVVKADFLDKTSFKNIPTDIEVAYFLLHAMSAGGNSFAESELQMAINFCKYANSTSAKQIIYLSGISNDDYLSKHLQSRLRVEEELWKCRVPLTVLRAAIIVGSGSASFEIIRDLVEKLPIMVAPKWLNTRCQPIAVRNVIHYLVGVMGRVETYSRVFDIGGPTILTYKEMLYEFGRVRKLKRCILTLPILSPRLSSYWLYFVTSTSYRLARTLVDSLRNEVIVKNGGIEEIVPQELLSYSKSIELAFDVIEQNLVASSWKDALNESRLGANLSSYINVPINACFIDRKDREIKKESIPQVVQKVFSLGGYSGWPYQFLWEVRGFVDQIIGGVGLRRGRRDSVNIIAGDSLDFWRVLYANKQEGRLLLLAEMKLPGEAWLEFSIVNKNDATFLVQKATFRPRGLMGRAYWYLLYIPHFFIFRGMVKKIAQIER